MALDTVAMLPLLLVARESGRKPTRTADDDDDDDAWACSSLQSTVDDIRLTYHASLLYLLPACVILDCPLVLLL